MLSAVVASDSEEIRRPGRGAASQMSLASSLGGPAHCPVEVQSLFGRKGTQEWSWRTGCIWPTADMCVESRSPGFSSRFRHLLNVLSFTSLIADIFVFFQCCSGCMMGRTKWRDTPVTCTVSSCSTNFGWRDQPEPFISIGFVPPILMAQEDIFCSVIACWTSVI